MREWTMVSCLPSTLRYCYIRWNSWRWKPILERWGHLSMFIDPRLLKSTTFLVEKGEEVGTVFFVSVPLGTSQANIFGEAFYAVTVGHCIGDGVCIRWPLSANQGDTPTLERDWITDDDVDLAIYPLPF